MAFSLPSGRAVGIGVLAAGCLAIGQHLWSRTDWKQVAAQELARGQAAARLEQARSLVQRAPRLEQRTREVAADLYAHFLPFIAPATETFQWASQFVTLQATRAGLDISVLTPLSVRVAPWEGATAEVRPFALFAVRLDVLATYPQALKLVRLMEEDNPLLTLTSMSITDTGHDAGKSRVTMVWEWPMWRQSADARALEALIRRSR